MGKYKFSPAPWFSKQGLVMQGTHTVFGCREYTEVKANINLCVLAPTLHEVVTKCQEVLSQYLEPEGKTKEEAIKELLDILDDKELVVKLKELEIGFINYF